MTHSLNDPALDDGKVKRKRDGDRASRAGEAKEHGTGGGTWRHSIHQRYNPERVGDD